MEQKTKKLGKKTYIYDEKLKELAQEVAFKHNIDIEDTNIEFALVFPEVSKNVAGRCRLVYNEYTLMTDVNYLITFSGELWGRLTDTQKELLVAHELMHILKVTDDEGNFKRFGICKHDVEDFRYLITKFGVDWINFVSDTKALQEEILKLKEDLKKNNITVSGE